MRALNLLREARATMWAVALAHEEHELDYRALGDLAGRIAAFLAEAPS
jgi:hypothetical protein